MTFLEKHKCLLNPRLSPLHQQQLQQAVLDRDLADHMWLLSSGTESRLQGDMKLVGLSHQALLNAAAACVEHFAITSKDIYLNVLPTFHIGGLSTHLRAFYSGCRIYEDLVLKWSPQIFVEMLQQKQITLCSLVPTQLHDIVRAQLKAPVSLRLVFIGAGALSQKLFIQAQELGWPLVLTYGMTETSAMIAYKNQPLEGYQKLPHLLAWCEEGEQRLKLKATSLFSEYIFVNTEGKWRSICPIKEAWFMTDDRGEIKDDKLYLLGRQSELVKVGGESVSIAHLQSKWDELNLNEAVIVALEDERLGHKIALVSSSPILQQSVDQLNKDLMPFEQIRDIYLVDEIPRNEMGKINRQALICNLV